MGYFKATAIFTRATRGGMIVGNPKHKDPRGRFFVLNDAAAAQQLVDDKLIAPITAAEYHKGIADEAAAGGDAAAGPGRASPTMSNQKLDDMAAELKVDVSKAKNRGEKVKLINAKLGTGQPGNPEGADPRRTRVSMDTLETTRHPRTKVATGAEAADLPPGPESVIEANDEITAEEQAPTGGGGSQSQ